MRNWLAMSMVAVCICLLSCDASMALGGNSGGGKNVTRGRFLVTNTGPAAVRVLIQPAGTALPATLGAIEASSFVVGSGSTDVGPQRNSGAFDIYVVEAAFFANALTAGGAAAPSAAPDDSVLAVSLAGADVTIGVSTTAGNFAQIDSISR